MKGKRWKNGQIEKEKRKYRIKKQTNEPKKEKEEKKMKYRKNKDVQ